MVGRMVIKCSMNSSANSLLWFYTNRNIIFKVFHRFHITYFHAFKELMDNPESMNILRDKNQTLTAILRATDWLIWWARNDFIFSSSPLSVSSVVDKLLLMCIRG